MNQEERLTYLIEKLKEEDSNFFNIMDIDNCDFEYKKRIFRSLVNLRMPRDTSYEFLEIQDEFLQEEINKLGIVDTNKLPFIKNEFPCTNIKNDDKISLFKGDITRLNCDAIVNAANSKMLGCFVPCHGCIDNAIHTFAGVQLRQECDKIMKAQGHDEATGQAKITNAYNLPCKYVIHTVGPIVRDFITDKLKNDLKSCYENCLKIAEENKLKSIAFCCISTGEFHFDNEIAADIAVKTIDDFLDGAKYLERVIINVFKEKDYIIYRNLFQ